MSGVRVLSTVGHRALPERPLNCLLESGVSFGILGVDEISDGNEVDLLGEDGLFEELAQNNIRQFSDLGVKSIITLSPHSYNTLKT
jgi:Fe-S oxidoreductase